MLWEKSDQKEADSPFWAPRYINVEAVRTEVTIEGWGWPSGGDLYRRKNAISSRPAGMLVR